MKGRKKHSWKRIAALLLVFAMVINMIPADVFTTFAATATHQNDFTITVKDTVGNSIPNAIVSVTYGEAGAQLVSLPSDGNGEVVISQFTDGTAQAAYGNAYTISCTAEGYVSETKSITVENTDTSNVDIVLYKSVTLTGIVSYEDVPEVGATVTYTGDGITGVSAITGETGQFTIPNAKKAANPQLTITSTNEKFQEKVYTPVFTEEAATDCGNIALDVKTFDITFTDNGIGTFADEAGNAIPNNTWNVEYGTDVAFAFTENTGYENVAIVVNDVALEAMDGKYVIRNITVPYTVVAQGEDTQAPTISNVNVSDAKNWTKEKEITFIAEDNSGIAPTTYVLPTLYGTYEELQETGANAVTSPYKVTENGTYYIYAVDATGNFVSRAVTVNKIDVNEPVSSEISTTTTGYGKNRKVMYSFTASDNESGIKSIKYSTSETGENATSISGYSGKYSFSVKNNYTYYVFIEDNAGNIKVINTKNSDLTSPVISILTELDSWVEDRIPVEFTVTDNEKVESVYWSTEDFSERSFNKSNAELLTVSETGAYSFVAEENDTYYIYAFDATGNMGMESVEIGIVDDLDPTIKVTKTPNTEWHNSNVMIKVEASDDVSGVQNVFYTEVAESSEGETTDGTSIAMEWNEEVNAYTITETEEVNIAYDIWAVDNVNRTSKKETVNVKIDKEPAQINSILYEVDENNVLEDLVHIFTFGLAFRENVIIDIKATDNREVEAGNYIDSGISEIQYLLVEEGMDINTYKDKYGEWKEDAWKTGISYSEGKGYGEDHELTLEVGLNKDIKDQFKGSVYIRVLDLAGNDSEVKIAAENGTIVITDNTEPTKPSINPNGYEADGWTNSNVKINLSGGVTASGVKEYQYKVVYADSSKTVKNWECVPEKSSAEEDAVFDQITIKDNTNATYYFRAVSNTGVEGDAKKIQVKIQKTKPDNAETTVTGDNGNNEWYVKNGPVIEIIPPVVDQYEAPVHTYYKLWDTSTENEPEAETEITPIDLNDGMFYKNLKTDGIYKLKVWTIDEAGNTCDPEIEETEIKVDLTDPTELDIQLEEIGETDSEEKENKVSIKADNGIAFEKFYDKKVKVYLAAKDEMSDIAKLEYQKVAAISEFKEDGTWIEYKDGIVVEPTEKFIIYFRATDYAGNVSTYITSKGVVVDDKQPEGEVNAPDIDILPTKPNENGLYNSSVNIDLKVTDPKYLGAEKDEKNGYFSGLNKVTYRIYTEDTQLEKTGTLWDVSTVNFVENQFYGAIFDEDKLAKSWTGSLVVNPFEENGKFNSNYVVVEITAVDMAGNTRVNKVNLAIDTTAPTIDISYDNNTADNSKYFKANRTATITVTERNFDAKDVLTKITNTDGTIPSIGAWQKVEGTGNKDNTKWITTVTYSADGDYTFDIGYTDLAGNACSGAQYGTSVAPTDFTVDKTLPVINVSYDNNSEQNGKYFKDSRTATVTIKEHNFDVERVKFTQTASKNGSSISIPAASWTHSGDTHTARFSYAADGDYTFDVSATDMAGNESEAANYGNSVAGKEFTVDQTIEKPSVTGVENGKAYKDEVIPKISFQDINYDSHEIKLVRTRKGEKNVDVTNEFIKTINKNSQGASGVYDTFAIEPENDGIYTLTVKMVDKAGNEETEEITFTVNRFGSVYEYDDYLVSLISNGGSYEQTIEGDLIITEYNADRLVGNSLVIEITRDGKPLDNVIYDVTPGINDKVKVGESGWYQYQYTISKDNFKLDGVYKISISSKDASGNSPENSNYEDKNILFRVDSTLPEITSIVGLEESIINAPEVEVKYTVYDTIGLKSIKIMVNGKQLGETITDFGDDLNNYTGSFILSEDDDIQNVQILVEDLSGNITDTDAEEFVSAYTFNKAVTVSTKWYIRWFANKPLFWGTMIGGAALLAVLFFIILAKRKKDEEEEV